jgi:hypothetical protein
VSEKEGFRAVSYRDPTVQLAKSALWAMGIPASMSGEAIPDKLTTERIMAVEAVFNEALPQVNALAAENRTLLMVCDNLLSVYQTIMPCIKDGWAKAALQGRIVYTYHVLSDLRDKAIEARERNL